MAIKISGKMITDPKILFKDSKIPKFQFPSSKKIKKKLLQSSTIPPTTFPVFLPYLPWSSLAFKLKI